MIFDPQSSDVLGNMGCRTGAEFSYLIVLAEANAALCQHRALTVGDGLQDIVKMFGAAHSADVPDTRHKGRIADSPMMQRAPLSKTTSYQLKKARKLAEKYRESGIQGAAASRFDDSPDRRSAVDESVSRGRGGDSPSAYGGGSVNYSLQLQYLSKVNRALESRGSQGRSRQRAQQLANDDSMDVPTKLQLVQEEVRRLTQPAPAQTHRASRRGEADYVEGDDESRQKRTRPSSSRRSRKDDSAASMGGPSIEALAVDWELVNEYLILQLGLSRLLYGDWGTEVAKAELELGVSYIILKQPALAREHAELSKKAAHAAVERDPVLEVKADLLEAAAIVLSRENQDMSRAVTLAFRAADNFMRCEGHPVDAAEMFPFYYVQASALFLEGASHQRSLDAVDNALKCCTLRSDPHWSDVFHLHTIKVAAHVELLSRVTQELLGLPAKSSKEKLFAQLHDVSTTDEIETISSKLGADLKALGEKRKTLQLTLVRQAEYIKEEVADALQCWELQTSNGREERRDTRGQVEDDGSSRHQVLWDLVAPCQLLPIAKVLHSAGRGLWIGQQPKIALKLLSLAAEFFRFCIGADHPITTQCEVDRATLMSGAQSVPCITFLESYQQEAKALTPATAGTNTEGLSISRSEYASQVNQLIRLTKNGKRKAIKARGKEKSKSQKKAQRKSKEDDSSDDSTDSSKSSRSSSRSGDSSDDDDPEDEHEQRLEGCRQLEAALDVVGKTFGPTSGTSHFLSTVLEKGYARLGEGRKEMVHTALLCDIYATLLGPTHPKTVAKLGEFEKKRGKVHPPLFSPSWGVVPFLSQVTITSVTPAADIYFTTNGETPSEDAGVHQSLVYTGPIIMDTLGRVTVKAFAVKDGKRSGIVEAHYTVMKR